MQKKRTIVKTGPVMSPTRRLVIKVLQAMGGEIWIEDMSDWNASATNLLWDLMKQEGYAAEGPHGLATQIQNMEKDGLLWREKKSPGTKRIQGIGLTPLLRDWDPNGPAPWTAAGQKLAKRTEKKAVLDATMRALGVREPPTKLSVPIESPGEVVTEPADLDLTEEEFESYMDVIEPPPDPFTQMAKALLAEVLEIKARGSSHDSGLKTALEATRAELVRIQTERDEYQNACITFKKLHRDAEQELEENKQRIGTLQEQLIEAQGKVEARNKTINNFRRTNRELERAGVPFDQHMTEEAYKEWQKIMQAIPSRREA